MRDNRREWARRSVASKYEARESLFPSEQIWLDQHGERFRGARILDIGVGCGRTTPHLASLAANYVGVDYSAEMVRCAKRRWPGVDFRVGDARALEISDASVDLVVFSFNGIDMVDRADRSRVVSEVHRVLVPRGTFFFSSHNLCRAPVRAYDPRQINLTANPLKLTWRVARWAAGVVHHLERRRHEVRGDGWAILNDKANNYRLLTYYGAPRLQRDDLEAAGFELLQAIDPEGAAVDVDRTSDAKFIYYSCAKSS